MIKVVNWIFDAVDGISDRAGQIISVLVFLMMLITAFEVVARYVFNHPTIWVRPINKQIFAVFILFGGVYALRHGGHIRIEMVYSCFPPRFKRFARFVDSMAFVSFMGVLIWQGSWVGWNSLISSETAGGAFPIPLYPLKMFIPLVAVLFIIQEIVNLFRGRD